MKISELIFIGNKIKEDSDQDNYRKVFHKPPDRVFIEAHKIEDVSDKIKP